MRQRERVKERVTFLDVGYIKKENDLKQLQPTHIWTTMLPVLRTDKQGFGSGSGSGFQISLDPDPVCPERLDPDPDPVNIRPDPKPCS